MADPRISIVIPLWNGRASIEECLRALLAETDPFDAEIIVVDNASPDGAGELVDVFSGVQLIRNERNLGFAGGCNVGLRRAQGDLLVLLNQDTEVQRGWLRALLNAFDDPAVGVVGCRMFLADGHSLQHAGGTIEWPLGLAQHRGYGQPSGARWMHPTEVDFVTGAAMAFRREVLAWVGWLDEAFWPGYYEDVDFCYRARAAGYKIWYAADATLIHSESTAFRDPFFTAWARLRARLRFCLKHLPPERFVGEFLPAETTYRPFVLAGDQGDVLRRVYLLAIPMAVTILHRQWRAPAATIQAAVDGLYRLYDEGFERQGWPFPPTFIDPSINVGVDPNRPNMQPVLTPSPLSRLPVVGTLWQRLRLAVHRLVIFYVQRNKRTQSARFAALQQQNQEQAARIASLEEELARLRRQT